MRVVSFFSALCVLGNLKKVLAVDAETFSSALNKIKNRTWKKLLRCDPQAAPPPDPCIDIPSEEFEWTQVGDDIDGGFEDGHSGISVSINANATRVAIGEYSSLRLYDSILFVDSGATSWTIGGNLGSYFDEYVVSIALSSDGMHMVAGEQETIGKMHVGKVYVFEYVDDTVYWVQSGNSLNGTGDDEFGRSVDISDDGTIIAIGAPNGAYASVYGLVDLTWELKIMESSGNFGRSVAISSDGKMAAMGTPSPEDGGPGSVYIYEIGNDSLIQKIDGDMSGDEFGYSLGFAYNGARIVVGAPSGAYVKIFDFDTSSSQFVASPVILRATAVNSDYGKTVAVSGDGLTVAVGAPDSDEEGENAGKAFTYLVNNCGDSKLIGTFSGEATQDNFGYAVDLNGNGSYVALGAINNEGIFSGVEANNNAGHVRVFKREIITE